ncbi:MAG TPA: hypothetical protein VJ997_15460 [Longimicrobiales bacterium]|nr:hypothetical protein [Longimicrobiales bacterium]
MKTNAARTETQKDAGPAASEPARTRRAPSSTPELELHREPTMGIDESPRMVAQREQMAGALRPRRDSPTSSGDGTGTQVLQRDPFDEPLVDFIKTQGRHAATAYDLLRQQVEVGRVQVALLEAYAGPVGDDDEPKVAAAKRGIAESAAAVRERITALPDEVSEARATALGLAGAVSLATPHELFDDWTKQSVAATGEVAMAQAKAAGMLVRIKQQAVEMATVALDAGEIQMMRGLLKVADDSDAAAADGDRVVAELNGDDPAKSSGKQKLGLATTVGDATNNMATGVAFGVVGALAEGGVFSLSTAAASALGVIGGVLGILFGSIGVFLGVKNAIRGAQSKKKLADAKSKVSNSELEAIAEYAIGQKDKKVLGNVAATVGGLAAIGAGVLGLVALSVATFGIGAIVAGIGAALIGLGILGYRIIHHWRKRKAERVAFAKELIDQVQGNRENAQQARQIISGVGMDPAQAGQPKFEEQLTGNLKGYVKSKRTRMAEGLVKSVVAGKPSEVFDAELILGALGVDPEWVRAQVTAEKPNKAVSKVAGKMASW